MEEIVPTYGECEAQFYGTCNLFSAVDRTLTGLLAQVDNDNVQDICA